MTSAPHKRGGAPVGFLSELDGVEAASVVYLRLWAEGAEAQTRIQHDFAQCLGADPGRRAMENFENLCGLCARHGRRPLMRHAVECSCLGADESCFANFIAAATSGEREDAMLIATLLVRADMAPLLTALATDVGLALRKMKLSAPTVRTPAPAAHHRMLH